MITLARHVLLGMDAKQQRSLSHLHVCFAAALVLGAVSQSKSSLCC